MEREPIVQEPDNVATARLLRILLSAALVVALGLASSTWLGAPSTLRAAGATPPRAPAVLGLAEQTLIGDGERGLREQRAARRDLAGYHWQERALGRARIPIERAIDLSLER